MKFILGRKIEMSQIFQGDEVIPVTIIKAGKCKITQIKNKEKDGYQAVQLGFEVEKKLNKPEAGHLKNSGKFRHLREFRITDGTIDLVKVGDQITVGVFAIGEKVKITGISKGKGFQGVVKRHGFHGSPKTHGHKDQLRMPGSIGATEPARVFKGTRMAGHMGSERVTIKDLEIIEIDEKRDLLTIKGAVPGARNGLLLINAEGPLNLKIEKEDVKEQEIPKDKSNKNQEK